MGGGGGNGRRVKGEGRGGGREGGVGREAVPAITQTSEKQVDKHIT